MRSLIVRQLGQMSYSDAWQLQDELFQKILQYKIHNQDYSGSGYLLFVEHPPVITMGKSAHDENLLLSAEDLQQKKIELIRSNRGGDITFHGYGQLVVYPILDLGQYFTDLKKYMRYLEEVVIRTLKDFGLSSGRRTQETGVWLEPEDETNARKICAMGVRTSRWVTMHGLALNINTDLKYFDFIIPCGIQNKGVTSMQKELGETIPIQNVIDRLVVHFLDVFDANVISQN